MAEQPAPWDDLRVVLAIARAGSLNGAAASLRTSHATLFRRINRIERSLGVRLFDRGHDGYTPTPAGVEMAVAAQRIEAEIDALGRRIVGQDLRASGIVRVTTTDTLLYGLLTPCFAQFRRSHPGIRLDVTADNALLDLGRRDADVAIRPSPDPPQSLVGRKVADYAVAIYAHRGSRAADRSLADVDWVTPDASLSQLRIARWLDARGYSGRSVYRANSFVAMLDAVKSGIGVALMPCYLGDREPQVQRVGEPIAELRGELWLLTHPDLRRTARVRAFVDFTTTALLSMKPLLAGDRPAATSPTPSTAPPPGRRTA
jgi:DNA-binding transcriptional LysR family regulator